MNSRLLIFLFVSSLITGCGGDGRPSLVPVSGTVTLNGEPLAEATIGFQPQGIEGFNRPSTATTDAQGKFTAGTYGPADGMAVGTYRVTVQKSEIVGDLPEGYNTEEPEANARPLKTTYIVPRIYSDPNESGLTIEVTSDGITPDVIALAGDAETSSVGGRANDP